MAGNQLSQLPVEVLIHSDAPITATLSQLPLEVLISAVPGPPPPAVDTGLTVLINGVDRTADVQLQPPLTLTLKQNERSTGSLTLTVGAAWPPPYAEIQIYSRDGTTCLFGGHLDQLLVHEMSRAAAQAVADVTCLDYSVYLDWAQWTKTYTSDVLVTQILTDLIAEVLGPDYGVTLDPLQDVDSRDFLSAGGGSYDIPAGGPAKAQAFLTFHNQPDDGHTVTLGSTTYTFRSPFVNATNTVAVGANLTDTLQNLIAAITAGAGIGTIYGTGTTANADADAFLFFQATHDDEQRGSYSVLKAQALVAGAAGNSIPCTTTVGAATWYGEGGVTRETLELGADAGTAPTVVATPGTPIVLDGKVSDILRTVAGWCHPPQAFRINAYKELRMYRPGALGPTPIIPSDAAPHCQSFSWSYPELPTANFIVLACGGSGQDFMAKTWIADGVATAFEVDIPAGAGPPTVTLDRWDGTYHHYETVMSPGAVDGMWVWDPALGKGTIYVNVGVGTTPGAGDTLTFAYTAQFPYTVVATSGETPKIVARETTDERDPIKNQATADALLLERNQRARTATMVTFEGEFIQPGQIMPGVTLTARGLHDAEFTVTEQTLVAVAGNDPFLTTPLPVGARYLWQSTVTLVESALPAGTYLDQARTLLGLGGGSAPVSPAVSVPTVPALPGAHAATHSSGGADPVTVTNLAGYPGTTTTFLRGDHTFATPPDTGVTQLTGDVLAGPGSGAQAATIAADAVTYSKLQNISAASRVLGRGDAGAGDPEELTLGGGLTMSGTTLSGARNSALVNYTYNTSTTEPPSAGQVRTNTTYPWTSTTKLWIRFVSVDNQDVYWGLMLLSIGSTLLLQDQDDHTLYGRFTVTGAPIDKGLYAEVPVVWTANGGAIATASRVLMQATALSAASRFGALTIVLDGGGVALTTGVKGFFEVPFACVLLGWTLLSTDAAATAGSIVIDLWKDVYGSYPPTVADTITASAKPTLSSASKNQSSTLTGWTTAVTAGDILGVNVDSATTVTKVTLSLKIQAV